MRQHGHGFPACCIGAQCRDALDHAQRAIDRIAENQAQSQDHHDASAEQIRDDNGRTENVLSPVLSMRYVRNQNLRYSCANL